MASFHEMIASFCKAMHDEDYNTALKYLSEAEINFGAAASVVGNVEHAIPWAGRHTDAKKFFETFLTYIELKNFHVEEIIVDGTKYMFSVNLDVMSKATGKLCPFKCVHTGDIVGKERGGMFKTFNIQTDTYLLAQFLALPDINTFNTREAVIKFHNAMKSMDWKVAAELLSSAKIRFGPPTSTEAIRERIPWAGAFASGSTFLQVVQKSVDFKSFAFDIVVVEGNHFAVHVDVDITIKGDDSSQSTSLPHDGIHMGTVENGKITELNIQTDTFTLFHTLQQQQHSHSEKTITA